MAGAQRFSTLLSQLPSDLVLSVEGEADRPIEGIVYDSRRVRPGTVFVCIQGEKEDGRSYVGEALRRGAGVLVLDERTASGIEQKAPCLLRVREARKALAYLSQAFYENPSRALRVVAVLGTSGKETRARLGAQVARAAGKKAAALYGMHIEGSKRHYYTGRTVPQAPEYAAALATCRQDGEDLVFLPVPRASLHYHRATAIRPWCCWIQFPERLSEEELAYCRQAKLILAQTEAPLETERLFQDHPHLLTYGPAPAPLTASLLSCEQKSPDRLETCLHWKRGGEERCYELRQVGHFAAYHAIGAALLLEELGVEAKQIPLFLQKAEVPGLLQVLLLPHSKLRLVIDAAWRPEHLEKLIEDLRPACAPGGKLRVLFGSGGNRPYALRHAQGRALAGADAVYLTVSNPRSEAGQQIVEQLAEGLRSREVEPRLEEAVRVKALETLLEEAQAEDLLLILGKGDEAYLIDETHLLLESDEETVRRWDGDVYL